ncbi:hypothetical protein [Rivularia sp. UHCC 0363]|uniref:hypothetical protein n=1 Tax=Rivularia sp. UHCC 0363 TaxID=3110244 RepID=UPI002B20DDF5|nr:hypothetical protein [Rivularia sp. UHCC 0363]MEA5598210.1 hypothetical protein [Rivularia sp. UHCC 0363]
MIKTSRESRRNQLTERHPSILEIIYLPQQFIEQSVNIREVNFAHRAHIAVFCIGAIDTRSCQQVEQCDRQSNPGVEFVAQKAKPNKVALDKTRATHNCIPTILVKHFDGKFLI